MGTTGRMGLSRRRFLGQAARATVAGTGLALVAPLASNAGARATSTQSSTDALVIGAGLSGLAAAWELEAAGLDVAVLEARARSGGRVRTLREPFAGDLYAEAGAVAFSEAYTEANRFIDELGLERADWAVPDLQPLYHLRGQRFSAGPEGPSDWPYDLTAEERELGPTGILQRYAIDPLPDAIGNPQSWDREPLIELDRVSLGAYMRRQGASQEAVNLVADTQFFGPRIDNVSALSAALAEFGLFFAGAPFAIADGNDRLPTAMANRLSRTLQYGVEVTGIRETQSGVEVVARRGRRAERFRADRVVCTVPAPVLRGIDVRPPLPASKRLALRNMPYIDTTVACLQVRRALWHDEGVTGSASTDLPIDEVTRAPTPDAAGPQERAVLKSAPRGPAATRLGVRAEDKVLHRTLRHLDEVHPGIVDVQEGGIVKAWGQDPYALGCVSWPGPGDVSWNLKPLQRPHGRIHFAGEHTSVLRSTMEGALRSGVRAAAEITDAR